MNAVGTGGGSERRASSARSSARARSRAARSAAACRTRSASSFRLCFAARPLPRARPARPSAPRNRLGLGDGVLARFERPHRLVRSLLFLFDVGLEARQRALDLLERLRPVVELRRPRGDALLDALDCGRALLDVTLPGSESRQR